MRTRGIFASVSRYIDSHGQLPEAIFNRLRGRYLCRSYLLYATRASLHPRRSVSMPIRWLDESINTRTHAYVYRHSPRRRHIDRRRKKKKKKGGNIIYSQPAGPRIENLSSRFSLDSIKPVTSMNILATRVAPRESAYIDCVKYAKISILITLSFSYSRRLFRKSSRSAEIFESLCNVTPVFSSRFYTIW